jgi:multidrug efflux pump subunit AcrB
MKDSLSQNVSNRGHRGSGRRRLIVGLLVVCLLFATAVGGYFAFGLFKAIFFPNKPPYPPAIVVRANYPGANAQVVADTVAAPIEQQVIGVEGMTSMTSQCTNDGEYILTVTFKPGSDLNISQVLVQNRVSLAQPTLPDVVNRHGLSVRKKPAGVLMYVVVTDDGRRNEMYLSNVATTQVVDELARVPGVAEVTFLGQRDYGVRIVPDPEKLAARDLTALDAIKFVERHKAELEAGGHKLQDESAIQEQLGNLVVKTDGQGHTIYLRDVAAVEIGAFDVRRYTRFNGRTVPVLAVSLVAQAKPSEVAAAVRDKLGALQAVLPEGVRLEVALDFTPNLETPVRPTSDYLRLDVTLPDSASTERTLAVLDRCEKIVKDTEGAQDVLSLSGPSIDLPENHGCVLVRLATAAGGQRAPALRDRLSAEVQEAVVRVCEPTGGGGLPPEGYPIELAVCDLGDTGLKELTSLTERVTERLAKSGKLTDVWADPRSAGVPTLSVRVDAAKANALGVLTADINQTLRWYLESYTVPDFTVHGRTWKVVVASPPPGLSRPENLQGLMVRGADGQLVRLGNVAEIVYTEAPPSVRRFNLYPMVKITAGLKPGVTPAEARALCEDAFAQEVPSQSGRTPAYRLEWLRNLPGR